MDTLRSIAEGMVHSALSEIVRGDGVVVRLTGCDDKRSCHEIDADELETWLAVNLERIKAQARLEEAKWWESNLVCFSRCKATGRIAALEAQAKEKP